MKTAMTRAQFDALASRLLTALPRINDSGPMLCEAQQLLDADLVVLLQRDELAAENVSVLATWPREDLDWAKEHLAELRGWCVASTPYQDARGYTREARLEIGARSFADALIAFGLRSHAVILHRHELLVFQKAGASVRYDSYHCTVAAALLWHFEHIEMTRKIGRELALRERYAGTLTREVLPDESWGELITRLEATGGTKDAEFVGPMAVQWTAYQVRNAQQEGKDAAHLWLAGRVSWSRGLAPYHAAVGYLLRSQAMSIETVEIIKALLERQDEQGNEQRKAGLMMLEAAWRRLVDDPREPAAFDTREELRYLEVLLQLTAELAAETLVGSPPGPAPRATEIGRHNLRLYLATLVIEAPSLRKRYLWLDGGDSHRQAPSSVRAHYVRNLSRYLLGVVEILERRSQIKVSGSLVSPLEFLDSLLYLVDRFVHVELAVEECLDVRKHLARGYMAEVRHHLARPFYRDHLVHVIDVFLLGHLLLNASVTWLRGENRRFVEHLVGLNVEHDPPREALDWMRQWAVAALLHDIGEQLNRGAANDKADRDFQSFFAALGDDPDTACGDADSKSAVVQRLLEAAKAGGDDPWWLPSAMVGFFDHGILSTLRISALLRRAEQARGGIEKQGHPYLLSRYSHSLHAMAHHNLGGRVALARHPLACLLRLCDELQEWGRPRVDIEQVVKQLYLTLEGSSGGGLDSRENLDRIMANLSLARRASGAGIEVTLQGEAPTFSFLLVYRDAVKAHYDATTTFLAKAFNLQHLDLEHEDSHHLAWRIEMEFPQPKEYGGLTEYDIYCLFALESRALPELSTYTDLESAMPGLSRLDRDPEGTALYDRFAIVVDRGIGEGTRMGWLRFDPRKILSKFIDFKKELLIGRAPRAE